MELWAMKLLRALPLALIGFLCVVLPLVPPSPTPLVVYDHLVIVLTWSPTCLMLVADCISVEVHCTTLVKGKRN